MALHASTSSALVLRGTSLIILRNDFTNTTSSGLFAAGAAPTTPSTLKMIGSRSSLGLETSMLTTIMLLDRVTASAVEHRTIDGRTIVTRDNGQPQQPCRARQRLAAQHRE